MKRFTIPIISGLAVAVPLCDHAAGQVRRVKPPSEQRLKEFMRAKLEYAKQVLEGITREDFNLIWNRQLTQSQWLVGNQVEIKGEIQASERGPKDEYSTETIPQGKVRDYSQPSNLKPTSLIPTPN